MLVGIIAALGVCAILSSVVAVVLYRRNRKRRSQYDYANNPIYGASGAKKVGKPIKALFLREPSVCDRVCMTECDCVTVFAVIPAIWLKA